jgi:hypothetical protein
MIKPNVMKNFYNFSENFIKEFIHALRQMIEELLCSDFVLNRKQLLTEKQVAIFLGVSERTMRTYRAEKQFHFIKLDGNIYYLSIIFYLDLIIKSLESSL